MLPFINPMMLGGRKLNVDDVFATTLSSGGGNLTFLPFAPEFNWHKSRSLNQQHYLIDQLRQAFTLDTSSVSIQTSTNAIYVPNGVDKFVRSMSGGSGVSWSFRRAPKFFDIVTYTGNGVTGRQIPHNLGVKPGLIVVKSVSASGNWPVHHTSIPITNAVYLNLTNASVTGDFWSSDPTSINFTLGASGNTNATGVTYVVYLFAHDINPNGIVQCGQYTGNGSVNGPIVNLGWEPQWILIKRIGGTGNWILFDNKRTTSGEKRTLYANLTNVETTFDAVDYLSNGFRLKSTDGSINTTDNYIYMAIRKGLL